MPGLKSSLTTGSETLKDTAWEVTGSNIDTAISDGRDIATIFRQLAGGRQPKGSGSQGAGEPSEGSRLRERSGLVSHKAWDDF